MPPCNGDCNQGRECICECKEPTNMVTVPLDKLEDMQRRLKLNEWQSLTHEEFIAIAKSIWGDNLGMGDGYGYTVAWASSYATIEPSSKMLLLLQAIDKALREKNT